MTDLTNTARAGRARVAFTAHEGDCMADLLADLMHLCELEGADFDLELNRAYRHFDAEREEA